jgi:6-pyruvoyl-tetrahydropterin synthase
MLTRVEVGRGEFDFSAAHAGLHDGELEPLHGHTFQVTLRCWEPLAMTAC